MTKCFILVILFSFYAHLLYAQTLTGNIIDNKTNEPIKRAFINIKKATEPDDILEYIIIYDGKFNYTLQQEYNSILLEINANGYYTFYQTIDNIQKQKTYSLSFLLNKDEVTELKEIVVKAKKTTVVQEDTVRYEVSKYADGSEKKIEDLIKKLPGVEVDAQGLIEYRGKPIETVLLENDDLFGFNYTLGTKNINVNMVEAVEAIDNYSENPLLKGIENGEKVVLNLKLKKGKVDFSGNLDTGYGLFGEGLQAFDMNTNLLGITKNYKSFATLAYNNIGINQSPFDYFGFSFNAEQLKEKDYFAQKIIPETRFSNLLDNKRANINNQLFVNYNSIFKINKRLRIKTNLYYIRDNIESNQFFENQYLIGEDIFSASDNTFINKKPNQYRGDIKLTYNSSKKSLLEYEFQARQENISTTTAIILNEVDNFQSSLQSEDFYLKQNLRFTQKLSDTKALQVSTLYASNDISQVYLLTPALFNDSLFSNNLQESNFKKNFLKIQGVLLGTTKKDKYSISLGANLDENTFNSNLFAQNPEESVNIPNAQNNLGYAKKSIFQLATYHWNMGNWQISPSYSVMFLNQQMNDKLENRLTNRDDFIFEPSLSIKYSLSSTSILSAKASYRQSPNAERHLFFNQVLINNRLTIRNIPSLELQKTQTYSIFYFNNNLARQFQMNASMSFIKNQGNFFSNSLITERTTQLLYFFDSQQNENFVSNLGVSKYVKPLTSTFKYSVNYIFLRYNNIVNNSSLRNNTNQSISNELFWKTAFDIPINFEIIASWLNSKSRSAEQQTFSNNASQNTFKIIIKPSKKWLFITSADYYIPDMNKREENFLFIDASLKYQPTSKKWNAGFVIRNLSNEVNFEQIQTSDVAISVFRSNLLPSSFLLNWSYTF